LRPVMSFFNALRSSHSGPNSGVCSIKV
jgi:hypothetical protein